MKGILNQGNRSRSPQFLNRFVFTAKALTRVAPIAESLDDPHTTPVRVTIVIYGCRDADLPQNTGDLEESALLSIQHVPVPVVSSQISRDIYGGNG